MLTSEMKTALAKAVFGALENGANAKELREAVDEIIREYLIA